MDLGPQWVIGWREWLELPGLGISAVKAKIDTGARSSALHVWDVEPFRRGGKSMIRFVVHPEQRNDDVRVEATAELRDERRVRSSDGRQQLRPVIVTPVRIRERTFDIELTLANRDEMGFRMLLGREALRGRFLVDPGRSFRAGRKPVPPAHRRSRR